ncbi:unnamed protein product [Ectocarpus sp. 8 AP-2014]
MLGMPTNRTHSDDHVIMRCVVSVVTPGVVAPTLLYFFFFFSFLSSRGIEKHMSNE